MTPLHNVGMRIAVISDIHGNLTAFEAVLADVRLMSPDLVRHGGDLADAGSNPVEIVDRIRDLGWPGVYGNTDEMLFAPDTLDSFALGVPAMKPIFAMIRDMAAWTRAALGEERMAWLRALPGMQSHGGLALVHASPTTAWRAPDHKASDEDLRSTFERLGCGTVAYGHIHRSYVRELEGLTVVNTGSVNLSYDGDPRASYLLMDNGVPAIRRVEYDVEREARSLAECGQPHADWVAKMMRAGSFQMPGK
jgi:predicted phosphodiesterase